MKNKNKLYLLLQSILICIPFFVDFKLHEQDGIKYYKPFITTNITMENKCILFFGILTMIYVLNKLITKDKKVVMLSNWIAGFFAFFTIIGNSYEKTASWDLIFSSHCFLMAIIMLAGYYIIYSKFLNITMNMILMYDVKSYDKKYFPNLTKFVDKHTKESFLIKIWIFLMLCWLPYLLIDYPAVIHADSGTMLWEYYSGNLSNHHPVLQTLFWGRFVVFGRDVLGSHNSGVFLFISLQFLYGSFIVALLFNYIKQKKYPTAIWFFSLLVVALMPAFPRNVTAVCKDSNYTLYLLLIVYLIFITIDKGKEDLKKNLYLLPIWFFSIIITCFSRKNGVHVTLLTLPFLLIYLRKNKKLTIALGSVFVLSFVTYFGGEYLITNSYDISNNNTRESMSIPFQQTARYLRDYGYDVTEEEKEIINTILDYDSMAESYSPELSNPIKDRFKAESTSEDLKNYLSVWFKQFFRHPDAYFQATLNGIYGYFYPNNIGYYKDLFFMSMCIDRNQIYGPPKLEEFALKLNNFNMQSRNVPLIGLFSSLGFFIWVDIFVTVFFIAYKKDKKFLIYNLPALITILVCISSPVNNTMRYGLPVMFLAPVLFCMCFKRADGKE